jgi:hypothetical protein
MQITSKRIVWLFLVAGFLVPGLLFSAVLVFHIEMGAGSTWILLIPWPTFPFMMSAEARGGLGGEILAFLQSALANSVVYGVVGLGVSFVYRRFVSADGANSK